MNGVENMLISLPHRKMSIWDALKTYTKEDYERADHLLEFVGLYEKRMLKSGDLSFGQQKLLEFAMALMNEPTCLLLDEPTAGINPTLIRHYPVRDRAQHARDHEYGRNHLLPCAW
jgi:branched-chain amino acid transport system ATP-binding protein